MIRMQLSIQVKHAGVTFQKAISHWLYHTAINGSIRWMVDEPIYCYRRKVWQG